MDDLRELLDSGAGPLPPEGLDVDDLRRRGTRFRRTTIALRGGASMLAVAAVATIVVASGPGLRQREVFVDDTPTPATTASPVTTAAPGWPVDLVVTVTTDMTTYTDGDPVPFEVEICNTGSATVRALGGYTLDLEVTAATGESAWTRGFGVEVDAISFDFSAGTCRKEDPEWLNWRPGDPAHQPGEYRVTATLSYYEMESRDQAGMSVWTPSAPAEFAIVESGTG